MITFIKPVNPLKMTKLVSLFTVFQLLMVLVIASSLESLRLGSRWVKRTKTGTSLLTLLKTWHEYSLSPSHITQEMPAFALAPCVCRRLVCSDGKKTQTQWACLMSALHTHTQTESERGGYPHGLCAAECRPAIQCSWLTSIQCSVWRVCLHSSHGSFCCFLRYCQYQKDATLV